MNFSKSSFIYKAHCENNYPSSKRLYGGIGYVTFQLCVLAATVISLCMSGELSDTVKSLLDIDIITSASLLGLSSITSAFGGSRSISVNDSNAHPAEDAE